MNLWGIEQNEYNPKQNKKYETIFTLANGYRGLRGVNEFSNEGWKGNFIAGIYDKADADVQEIVNNPDPLSIRFFIDKESINLDKSKILKFSRSLNMKESTLNTEFEIQLDSGKIIEVKSQRFVSMNNRHLWASKYEIIPKNFSDKLIIENEIDGTTTNTANSPYNEIKHYIIKEMKDLEPGILLKSETKDTKTNVIEATTIRCSKDYENLLKNRKFKILGEKVKELYELFIKENETYVVYKYGVTYTSRDKADDIQQAEEELNQFAFLGFEEELKKHIEEWKKIWDKIDIEIEGDEKAQIGIRFNVYQLTSCANKDDPKISIAAKGLHGEGYKGHIFWDTEIYMLPFFIYTQPDTARSLLLYRYHTLNGARQNASLNGYKGAQYAWESTDTGLETTPKWGKDYLGNPVRIWTGDEEIHISADIAFSIYEYFKITNDEKFMIDYGSEILFETAKFWESRLEYNYQKDRYEINKVIGPDEFHEHVNNNAYTNYLAKWDLKKACEISKWLKEKDPIKYRKLENKLGLSQSDFEKWEKMSEKIFIPRYYDSPLIEQFEGYFNLKDYTISQWDKNKMPLWPKSVELDKINQTQLVKQADVIMLLLLLDEEFDLETKKVNYEYYEKRTMHKSSLSPSMYSIMGLKVGDTHNAYEYFIKTVMTDLEDNQGNTEYGLHAASSGGSWQSVVYGFAGLSIDKEGILSFNPWLPKLWEKLAFKVVLRNTEVFISIYKDKVIIQVTEDININIFSKTYFIEKQKPFILTFNN